MKYFGIIESNILHVQFTARGEAFELPFEDAVGINSPDHLFEWHVLLVVGPEYVGRYSFGNDMGIDGSFLNGFVCRSNRGIAGYGERAELAVSICQQGGDFEGAAFPPGEMA